MRSLLFLGVVALGACNAGNGRSGPGTHDGGATDATVAPDIAPDSCVLGDRTCMGQATAVCGSDGTFHVETMCSTVCRDGLCDDLRCPDEIATGGEFSLPNNAWPRFRHDNRNSGWNAVVVADHPTLRWKAGPFGTRGLNSALGGMASGPVINQNNVVLVGAGDGDGKNGQLYALDKSGAQLWAFAGNRGWGYTTPAVRTDGTSYFSSQDGNAYAVDDKGMLAWKFMFGFQDDCSPIVTSAGVVIYGSDSHQLFAMDFSGKSVWTSDPSAGPGEVDAALAETCDGTVIAGGANGWVGLDAATGMTKWKVPATGAEQALMSSPLVAADGTMYGADTGGTVIAIAPGGKVLWQQHVGPGGAATSLAKVGQQLFLVTNDGMLRALDAASGTPGWAMPVNNSPEIFKHGGPVVDGRERLYFNSNDGSLYCFDTHGTMLWRETTSGVQATGANSLAEMAIGNDGTLYVPGDDGNLYAFQ